VLTERSGSNNDLKVTENASPRKGTPKKEALGVMKEVKDEEFSFSKSFLSNEQFYLVCYQIADLNNTLQRAQ